MQHRILNQQLQVIGGPSFRVLDDNHECLPAVARCHHGRSGGIAEMMGRPHGPAAVRGVRGELGSQPRLPLAAGTVHQHDRHAGNRGVTPLCELSQFLPAPRETHHLALGGEQGARLARCPVWGDHPGTYGIRFQPVYRPAVADVDVAMLHRVHRTAGTGHDVLLVHVPSAFRHMVGIVTDRHGAAVPESPLVGEPDWPLVPVPGGTALSAWTITLPPRATNARPKSSTVVCWSMCVDYHVSLSPQRATATLD